MNYSDPSCVEEDNSHASSIIHFQTLNRTKLDSSMYFTGDAQQHEYKFNPNRTLSTLNHHTILEKTLNNINSVQPTADYRKGSLSKMAEGKENNYFRVHDYSFIPGAHEAMLRDARQFINNQYSYASKTQKEIKLLKRQKELQENILHPFAPKICPKSEALFNSTHSKTTVFNRLYSQSKLAFAKNQSSERNKSVLKFSPEINKESKSLKRPNNISEMLYSDALRRNRKVGSLLERRT